MANGIPNYLAEPTAGTQTTLGTGGSLDLMSQLLNLNNVANPGIDISTGVPTPETGGVNLAGLGATLQGLTGLASAWAGLQGVKQGRKQLKFTKDLANRNLANQAQTVNTNLADRQARRVDAGGSSYQSVADYMKQNQVSGGAI